MGDEWSGYVQDKRKMCIFGSKCYQKNPNHLNTYKHPPKRVADHKDINLTKKRLKRESDEKDKNRTESSVPTINNDEVTNNQIDSKLPAIIRSESHSDTSSREVTYYDIPNNPDKLISEKFLVKMPEEFYKFWNFVKDNFDSSDVINKEFNKVGLSLVGPFDVLQGRLPIVENVSYLLHWRYFYDPPEFQTLFKCASGEHHIGYYRDDPQNEPVFVASNDSLKNCTITPIATNIFAAVILYLERKKKISPFISCNCQKLIDKLKLWLNKNSIDLDMSDVMKERKRLMVTKTFHGAGIVVPYVKQTQLGYRSLIESEAKIKEILLSVESAKSDVDRDKALSTLQPIITMASIAMDECDFGTGLELGLDLFCSGVTSLHDTVKSLLSTAYSLLNRNAFSDIATAHLQHRRKGSNLSIETISHLESQ